jgi:hypothetical protein
VADNDIELSLGVKFDESQFNNAYQSVINKAASKTHNVLKTETGKMKGSAADWGELPFYGMHDNYLGNQNATKAFIASLARDLKTQGVDTSKGSLEYQGALMNAVYRSTVPDPMERYHILTSQGFIQQADLTHPDSPIGKAIESDYRLMMQPWARDFIKTTNSGGVKCSYIDFGAMRDYAVEAGLGRWIDSEGDQTADNFELIDDALEGIEDKSDSIGKTFANWGEALKTALGVLTAIKAVSGLVSTIEKVNQASEKGTIEAGGTLDKRRAFIGMSALDELKTKVASRGLGLGEDAIKNEMYTMSDTIEQFKYLGMGDALPSSLLGIFDDLMYSDTPYETYKEAADKLYNSLKNADVDERKTTLMLMNKMGLGAMSSLIGQFLSNPEYATKYKTPSAMFDLEGNPFYDVYQRAELELPDLTKLNESIATSYREMELTWEKEFGKPFKQWWNDTLQNTIVPWTTKLMRKLGLSGIPATDDEVASDIIGKIESRHEAAIKQRNYELTDYSAVLSEESDLQSELERTWLGMSDRRKFGNSSNKTAKRAQDIIKPLDPFNEKTPVASKWSAFKELASDKFETKDFRNMPMGIPEKREVWESIQRARYMVSVIEETGLDKILLNNQRDLADTYILRAMQLGETAGDSWREVFDSAIDKLLGAGDTESDILVELRKISANTAALKTIGENPDAYNTLVNIYGVEKTRELLYSGLQNP